MDFAPPAAPPRRLASAAAPVWLAFALLGLYTLALLAGELTSSQEHIRHYFSDIEGERPFFAVNTSLSVFLLAGGALLLLFTGLVAARERAARRFFIAQAALLALFAADDRFQLHESLAWRLGIGDHYILLAWAVVELWLILLWCRRDFLTPAAIGFALAGGGFFLLMLGIDAFAASDAAMRLSVEDLAKSWGAAMLFAASWELARAQLRELAPIDPAAPPASFVPRPSAARAEADAKPVLVLGDDCQAFLAIVRSLGRRGHEVHGAAPDLSGPAFASRYLAAVHELPPYRGDGGRWAEAMEALIAEYDFGLVVPCSDASLAVLDHHGRRLGRDRLALAPREALAILSDKCHTRELARTLGIPLAPGRLVRQGDGAAGLVAEFGLPLVLKPCRSYALGSARQKERALILRDEERLGAALSGLGGRRHIVEAHVAGTGVGLSLLARRGEIFYAYQHRRRRQIRETGPSSVRVSEAPDQRLFAEAAKIARATGLHGVAMCEFLERADGSHLLLEVNPRPWGSLPLALAAGADFPAMLHDLLVADRTAAGRYRPGLCRRDLGAEYIRLVNAFERGGGWPVRARAAREAAELALDLLFGRQCDSWAEDDPGPWHVERRRIFLALGEGAARRLGLEKGSAR
ncbi:MAG: ATP-grasp domain-containing protein [Sphingomonadaceae bacterium]